MTKQYLEFKQDGVSYNLYDMPKGFVIKGDVVLSKKHMTKLPDLSEVTVEGNFDCSGNNIKSLKGAPKYVGGNFWCDSNKLTTLEGAPQEVGGSFYCDNNQLTSIKGAPKKIDGHFFCRNNPHLTSLVETPQMQENRIIACDISLAQKYGYGQGAVLATKLFESPAYINESGNQNRIAVLRQKLADGKELTKSEKQVIATENTRNAFDAWLKQNGTITPEK